MEQNDYTGQRITSPMYSDQYEPSEDTREVPWQGYARQEPPAFRWADIPELEKWKVLLGIMVRSLGFWFIAFMILWITV